MSKVLKLVEYNDNAKSWDAYDVLEDIKLKLDTGEIDDNAQMIVLYRTDTEDRKGIGFSQCGMKVSEMVALLEMQKIKLITEEM